MEPKDSKEKKVSDADSTTKIFVNIVYLCQALTFFFIFTSIIGVVLDYVIFNKAKGTWLESHIRWQLKTFWKVVIFIVISSSFILVGLLISRYLLGFGLFVLSISAFWFLYRIIRGWIQLCRNREVVKIK